MTFSQTWLPFLYLYGVGGIAFLFGLFIILKSNALRIHYQKHKTWLWVLFYGYLFYAAVHAIFIILAIGIYLIPVGIQYAAGGAGDFNMSKPTWGGLGNWSLAIIVILVSFGLKFWTKGIISSSSVLFPADRVLVDRTLGLFCFL